LDPILVGAVEHFENDIKSQAEVIANATVICVTISKPAEIDGAILTRVIASCHMMGKTKFT